MRLILAPKKKEIKIRTTQNNKQTLPDFILLSAFFFHLRYFSFSLNLNFIFNHIKSNPNHPGKHESINPQRTEPKQSHPKLKGRDPQQDQQQQQQQQHGSNEEEEHPQEQEY